MLDWVDTALLNLLAVDPSPIARSALQILFLTFSENFPMLKRISMSTFLPTAHCLRTLPPHTAAPLGRFHLS